MTEWKSDCIYCTIEQDTDDYGRYIASAVFYCSKGYDDCINCTDYDVVMWND